MMESRREPEIRSVPGFERSDAERLSIEERNRALGERVVPHPLRTVSIDDQAAVTVNPEKVPGTDAYAAKQERIASDMRSNRLY